MSAKSTKVRRVFAKKTATSPATKRRTAGKTNILLPTLSRSLPSSMVTTTRPTTAAAPPMIMGVVIWKVLRSNLR